MMTGSVAVPGSAQVPGAHVQARHAWHPDIEQGQVHRLLGRRPECCKTVFHDCDLVTALGQLERHQIPDVRIVISYQDMSHYPS
jgi:hypothetical protein